MCTAQQLQRLQAGVASGRSPRGASAGSAAAAAEYTVICTTMDAWLPGLPVIPRPRTPPGSPRDERRRRVGNTSLPPTPSAVPPLSPTAVGVSTSPPTASRDSGAGGDSAQPRQDKHAVDNQHAVGVLVCVAALLVSADVCAWRWGCVSAAVCVTPRRVPLLSCRAAVATALPTTTRSWWRALPVKPRRRVARSLATRRGLRRRHVTCAVAACRCCDHAASSQHICPVTTARSALQSHRMMTMMTAAAAAAVALPHCRRRWTFVVRS